MISIYLKSIKFLISAWIKLARNAFEDMAIFNGYPVICKWEGMIPQNVRNVPRHMSVAMYYKTL